MSGRVYLLGVAMALLAGAFALTDALLTPLPGVTARNVQRLREGMTLAEAEGLLGKHPGADFILPAKLGYTSYCWTGPEGSVAVIFARPGGRVGRVAVVYSHLASAPSPLARLRAWLGW